MHINLQTEYGKRNVEDVKSLLIDDRTIRTLIDLGANVSILNSWPASGLPDDFLNRVANCVINHDHAEANMLYDLVEGYEDIRYQPILTGLEWLCQVTSISIVEE